MAYNPQNPNGQATMANSEPVVLASDQSAIPVSGTVTATATNLDIRDLVFATDKVDVSGSTGVGVTGTFWQATQPVSGTFWQATQPVSLASTTITGSVAVTNAGVFVVQENGAALTALQLIDDTVVAQATALGTTKNSLIGGSVTTAAPTYVTGNINPLSLTTAGALRVDGSGVTQPISGTVAISTTTIDVKSTTTPVSTMNSASANSGVNSAMIAVFDDVSPTSITENNFGFVRMSANRSQFMQIRDANGNERGAAVNTANELSVALTSTVVLGTATYTEATSVGLAIGAVRRDAETTLVNTTNEWGPLQMDATGRLKVRNPYSSIPGQASTSVTNVNTQIMATNLSRLGGTIYNEGTAICYVKLGSTATTTSYSIQVQPGGYYEIPFSYIGQVDGITASGTALLRITTLT